MSSPPVDYTGPPASRSSTGGWRSAVFIIGVEIAERFAFYGISSNLISYLTGPLGQSTAAAAANVNAWGGTAAMLPLLGAFAADSFLGRYRTVVLSSLLYVLGLGLLTVSAVLLSGSSPTPSQVVLFYFSLYLVAVAQGGHKPCVQAFGADQFDADDPAESRAKSSFFNWWFFGVCAGGLATLLIVSYIQENLSWALGFGIPCVAMTASLAVFLLGTKTYRYSVARNEKGPGPFARIGRVFVAALRSPTKTPPAISGEEQSQSGFLDKALLATKNSNEEEGTNYPACAVTEVEEAKALLGLVPIWVTCLMYTIVSSQITTFFTKQGATMDRTIARGLEIPAVSLQCFASVATVLFVPVYDRVLIPAARSLTRRPSGITTLQRIGAGLFVSVVMMAIAALVEIKRLRTAREHGLVDHPNSTLPISIWWLVPQYVLFGVTDVFTFVGLQELFYDQAPAELKSVGLGLYFSVFGVGSFMSSFLVSVIEKATGGDGRESWFSDNLNRARLDYFYWLLAGLSAVAFFAYLHCARYYVYKRTSTVLL